MAGLKLSHIYKFYQNGVKAVNDFNMEIEDKEFIVFVGPSGCGKSTTLRMIAGLEDISAGELYIDDVLVNNLEPKDRDIAMVFQNYALYPHMTVYNNMAFGLKMAKIPVEVTDKNGNTKIKMRKYTKEEIREKINKAAKILAITEYLDRKPKAMSGGQRQRVALGRALVREPKVFLLDEPLSNLDAKLRTTMRAEISKLHKDLQTTFIYVTHDQVEAMTMGTKIVVMKDGYIQQIDTPKNLYRYPINKFVAGFIGTPQMNFFEGNLQKHGDKVTVTLLNTPIAFEAPSSYFVKCDYRYLNGDKKITIGVRPENVSIDAALYPFKAKCKVSHFEELGTECQIFGDLNIDGEDNFNESATKIIIKAPADSQFEYGQIIDISIDLTNIHLFDGETGVTIAPRIPEAVKVDAAVKANKLIIGKRSFTLPPAIALGDGQYSVIVPTSAVKICDGTDAEIIKEENINGTRLALLNCGGNILFALSGDGYKGNMNAGFDLDLKQLTIMSGDDTVIQPLQYVNRVNAGYVKAPRKTAEGADRKVTASNCFVIGNSLIDCPPEKAHRFAQICGNMMYKKQLRLEFDACAIAVADKDEQSCGISAVIVAVKDYGSEKFLVCDADGQTINVALDLKDAELFADKSGEEIKLIVDPDAFTVFDSQFEIRLI